MEGEHSALSPAWSSWYAKATWMFLHHSYTPEATSSLLRSIKFLLHRNACLVTFYVCSVKFVYRNLSLFLCWYTTGQTAEIPDVILGGRPWVYLQLHFTSVKPGGNTMYPVLNIHRPHILSTRYIRVILTKNSIISRLVLVLRKRCVLSFYTLKSPVAFKGCAVGQAVCRRPVTTKTWVRLCPWESGEPTGTGTYFFRAPRLSPVSINSPILHTHLLIRKRSSRILDRPVLFVAPCSPAAVCQNGKLRGTSAAISTCHCQAHKFVSA